MFHLQTSRLSLQVAVMLDPFQEQRFYHDHQLRCQIKRIFRQLKFVNNRSVVKVLLDG